MADMIKFYKGLVGNLPATGTNGALYITTDEGGIYLGTGTGMKRLGDFVQVDAVANLPAKAHEGCLYYCVAENILAKWNGTEWKQINKQPTAEELKTLLGLGSLAYKSEVAEGDLNADLKAKIDASTAVNHSHDNKGVLDGITAEKVSAWDASEKNAKDYADGLDGAMDTRVKALEAIDHEHSNKALLDTYTQTEENLADAVAKKHEHSNKTELDKIVAGDVAKWNGVVADHLTSSDKTALEDSIGDVSTALGEEVTRAKAAEKANSDAIAAIKDSTLIDSFADVETELGKKVDKVEGKSLVLDTEITKLAGVSAGANKVEASENGKIKIDGVDTVVYTHPDKHSISEVDGLQDALDGKQAAGNYSVEGHKHVKADITDFAHTHVAADITDLDSTIKGYDYATKTELGDVDKKFADYVKSSDYATDKAGIDEAIADRYTKSEADEKFAIKGADAYDDEEVRGLISDNADAISELAGKVGEVPADKTVIGLIGEEKTRAEGIEAGLRSDVDVIKGDYLKSTDKEELQGQINLIMNNPDTKDVIDSISEFTQYIADHGEIAEGFRKDIDANKKAIEDHEALAAETYETKEDAGKKLTEAKGYTDTEVAKDRERLGALEAVKDDYKTADATLKAELQGEIDSDVKIVSDALAEYKTSNDAEVAKKANSADVYAKTETYNKTEIEALLTWGEF